MTPQLPKDRAPSIRDVARLAGVSYQTVSRVLNNHPSIRESTKARVTAVMEEIAYRPNRAARMLVTRHSRTIGVLSASSAHYGPARSTVAVEDAARAAGYYVNIANLGASDPESISAALEHLMEQAIEGLVVIAPQVRVFDVLARMSIDVPYVSFAPTGGAEHLLASDQVCGCAPGKPASDRPGPPRDHPPRRATGPDRGRREDARLPAGEIDDAELNTNPRILGDWTADFGYRAGRELLATRQFSAVFAASDHMALGLVHAFREGGAAVPGDISVVGFDDLPDSRHFLPPLTTVRQDFAEIGRRAVAVLLGKVSGEPVTDDAQILPELVVRGSTGPARGSAATVTQA